MKFWNVVLEKIIWTYRVRNEEVLRRVKEERNIRQTIKVRKANWVVHILHRNCLLKHVTEGNIEVKAEGMRRRGCRLKQLMDDLKRSRRYLKMNEETVQLLRALRITCSGRGYGLVRQTTRWWWLMMMMMMMIQDMMTLRKCKYSFTPSALALYETEWSASRPGRFTPGEGISITQKIEGWLGLRAGLDTLQCGSLSFPTHKFVSITTMLSWLLCGHVLYKKFLIVFRYFTFSRNEDCCRKSSFLGVPYINKLAY